MKSSSSDLGDRDVAYLRFRRAYIRNRLAEIKDERAALLAQLITLDPAVGQKRSLVEPLASETTASSVASQMSEGWGSRPTSDGRVYFVHKPPVALKPDDVSVIFSAYNEADRLPYFLDYYRKLGIAHFFAIDNASTDQTAEILQDQSDVTYFFTDESFSQSAAGRPWRTELARFYANEKWCLTIDVDELLVFPLSETLGIKGLCAYLDAHNYGGLFAILLDMYSEKSLSQTIYEPHKPFLDFCSYFDSDSYYIEKARFFPFVHITGGPRQRAFFSAAGGGPSLRKVPLVKWKPDFDYRKAAHSCTPIRLADVTGAVLHFKLFSTFKDLAERESLRQDRKRQDHYAAYAQGTRRDDVVFFNESSRRYTDSNGLIEQGFMVCSAPYVSFAKPRLGAARRELIDRSTEARVKAETNGSINVKQMPNFWHLLHRDLSYGILFCLNRRIVGWHNDLDDGTDRAIFALIGKHVVLASRRTRDILRDESSLDVRQRSSAFVIDLPEGCLTAEGNFVRLGVKGGSASFASVFVTRAGSVAESPTYDGSCFILDNRIRGWAWCSARPDHTLWMSMLIDGRYWRRVCANQRDRVFEDEGHYIRFHAFSAPLPDWITASDHEIDITIEGTNLRLRNSPVPLADVSAFPILAG